jgi:hypothetical protein
MFVFCNERLMVWMQFSCNEKEIHFSSSFSPLFCAVFPYFILMSTLWFSPYPLFLAVFRSSILQFMLLLLIIMFLFRVSEFGVLCWMSG